ncbi:hypothetical protein E2C01_044789 [Portunus trituberculatus]|uniref:Uncharacterized protein n=1 Tax=Portunus trituberculatus TaxID=210409 RepID=A0A5B7G3B9_PORTR|nr:hypothetical protein [Portunus trituberculatus]
MAWSRCLCAQDSLGHTILNAGHSSVCARLATFAGLHHQALSVVCGAYQVTAGTFAASGKSHTMVGGQQQQQQQPCGEDCITVLITLSGTSSVFIL